MDQNDIDEAITIAATLRAASACADTVIVKYCGSVDLAPFACRANPKPSFVKRTCYDAKERTSGKVKSPANGRAESSGKCCMGEPLSA